MFQQAVEPLRPPVYGAVVPDFNILLSSYTRGWRGIQLTRYELAPQPERLGPPLVDAHVLQVCVKGRTRYESLREGSVKRALICPGELSLIPHGMMRSSSWTERFVADNIALSPELVCALAADLNSKGPERVELISRHYFRDPLVQQLAAALAAELGSGGLFGTLYTDTLAQALVLHLLQHHSTLSEKHHVPKQRGLSQRQLGLVLDFIGDYLAQDTNLADLAALVGLSTAHFTRQFKRSTGLPPHQYVVQRRVERARELLENSNLTITEVALAVGFFDQSHLNRHFKRAFKVSPVEVKRSRNIQG